MRVRFVLNIWNVEKSIAIYDSENTRVMLFGFQYQQWCLKFRKIGISNYKT